MKREQFYLSTIDSHAEHLARQYGLGLEIAEYCTAWNMDEKFPETHRMVEAKLAEIPNRLLHGPFNELFPCAIDHKARELTAYRYRQSLALARRYDAQKVIFHGGFNPWIYYPVWYTEQSIVFWKDFLQENPGAQIVLENVLEPESTMLTDIIKGVDRPNLQMCLDIGHTNAYSKASAIDWLENCAPYISHFHIHNNDSSWDTHSALTQGTIPMTEFLTRAQELCPGATFTLELTDAEASVHWLLDNLLEA